MCRYSQPLTTAQLLEKYRIRCVTEKQYNVFVEDFYQTQQDLAEVTRFMTDGMMHGAAETEEEKKIIERYNKLARHNAKLLNILERPFGDYKKF